MRTEDHQDIHGYTGEFKGGKQWLIIFKDLFSISISANVCGCRCPWRPDEGVGSLGIGVTGGCDPPDLGTGN